MELQKISKSLDQSTPSRGREGAQSSIICDDDISEIINTQRNQSESQCEFGEA
jgi:hypothetical protein